jgi:hypothetical protein
MCVTRGGTSNPRPASRVPSRPPVVCPPQHTRDTRAKPDHVFQRIEGRSGRGVGRGGRGQGIGGSVQAARASVCGEAGSQAGRQPGPPFLLLRRSRVMPSAYPARFNLAVAAGFLAQRGCCHSVTLVMNLRANLREPRCCQCACGRGGARARVRPRDGASYSSSLILALPLFLATVQLPAALCAFSPQVPLL